MIIKPQREVDVLEYSKCPDGPQGVVTVSKVSSDTHETKMELILKGHNRQQSGQMGQNVQN